jgi:UDP-N-acetylmuramoylalanine--D-glutamate ligase
MMALPPPRPAPGLDLAGRRVGVFGMARSGLACAQFLTGHGASVTVFDESPAANLAEALDTLCDLPVTALPGVAAFDQLPPFDLLVISPGVPVDHSYLQQSRAAGCLVIGEIELAWRFCAAPVVAVTGTNGKGSTTTLLGEMLTAAGLRCVVAGNIGVPLISVVEQDLEVLVAEISSFQLETIVDFQPWAGVLLNITPDHLTRHGSFDLYAAAKARLFENQGTADLAVINTDDPAAATTADFLGSRVLRVSLSDASAAGHLSGDELRVALPDRDPLTVCHRCDLALTGDHYVTNALGAAVVAVAAGCTADQIRTGVRRWRPASHLLTEVAVVEGVRFVDDSKATNPAAAAADLRSFTGHVLVIAGGQGKGTDLSEFAEAIVERCAAAFLIGETAAEIAALLSDRVPVVLCPSLEDAVAAAWKQAVPGTTVVLCPACASFDQFRNQAERGDRFAAAARAVRR